jgi:hypothetical protein
VKNAVQLLENTEYSKRMMNQVKLEMQTSLDKIIDETSDKFLKEIKEDYSNIDFGIIEERLKTKYMQDGHSVMILDGRKGIRIIVDHEENEEQSEINCKTEIKIFEKCGMKIIEHVIGEKVYSYVIQPEKEFYQELEKIPDSEWENMSVTRTISQDILGEIEKTATNIGFTLEEILQLMAENTYITDLRSKMKQ